MRWLLGAVLLAGCSNVVATMDASSDVGADRALAMMGPDAQADSLDAPPVPQDAQPETAADTLEASVDVAAQDSPADSPVDAVEELAHPDNSACQYTPQSPGIYCGNVCVNNDSNTGNCGSCGNVCPASASRCCRGACLDNSVPTC